MKYQSNYNCSWHFSFLYFLSFFVSYSFFFFSFSLIVLYKICHARRGAPSGAGPGARAPRAPWLIRPSLSGKEELWSLCVLEKAHFFISLYSDISLHMRTVISFPFHWLHSPISIESSVSFRINIGCFLKSFSINEKKKCKKNGRWPSRKIKFLYKYKNNVAFIFA